MKENHDNGTVPFEPLTPTNNEESKAEAEQTAEDVGRAKKRGMLVKLSQDGSVDIEELDLAGAGDGDETIPEDELIIADASKDEVCCEDGEDGATKGNSAIGDAEWRKRVEAFKNEKQVSIRFDLRSEFKDIRDYRIQRVVKFG